MKTVRAFLKEEGAQSYTKLFHKVAQSIRNENSKSLPKRRRSTKLHEVISQSCTKYKK